jgi:streptomycin 6-kinase
VGVEVPQPRPPLILPAVGGVDLRGTQATAEAVAAEWGLELGPAFALSRYSYVAPVADDAVLKVSWAEDEESLDEADALALWSGNGAVQLLRADKSRRALLEERAVPGDDISGLPEDEATAIAVDIATKLWRPAAEPFRWIGDHVPRWIDNEPRELTPLARELYASLDVGRAWLVHGDFHHHNILRHRDGFVAIDPKPYLADREYDVYTWLHNPLAYTIDPETTERRIAAFVAAGLDDYRIRAWAIIRGAYLGGEGLEAEVLTGLLD